MSAHRFRFRRGELEFELEGDRDFIEAQLAEWLPALIGESAAGGLSIDVKPAEAPEPAPTDTFHRVPKDFAPRVTITLADLIRMKEATRPVDVVTVAGYYMEKYRRQERYSPHDLQAELAGVEGWDCQSVEEPFELAVTSGFFEQLRDGSYTLTYKGQNYVQNGLVT